MAWPLHVIGKHRMSWYKRLEWAGTIMHGVVQTWRVRQLQEANKDDTTPTTAILLRT